MDYNPIFALIRASLWSHPLDPVPFQQINWETLFELAVNQTVVGHFVEGFLKLPKEYQPPKQLKNNAINTLMAIEDENKSLNVLVEHFFSHFSSICPSMVLMKGQSIAQRYSKPFYRSSGDIDLFCYDDADYQTLNRWATQKAKVDEHCSEKHFVFQFHGAIFENHRFLADVKNNRHKKRLEQFVLQSRPKQTSFSTCNINGVEVREFSPTFYAFFLLLHMAEHFMEDGLGLRHLCDWVVYLNSEYEKGKAIGKPTINQEEFWSYIQGLDLERMVHAFAQICVDDLGLKEEALPFVLIRNEKRYTLLKNAIFEGGNFGQQLYPWKGKVGKLREMWCTMLVKVPRYTRMYSLWPSEAIPSYSAMIKRGARIIWRMIVGHRAEPLGVE